MLTARGSYWYWPLALRCRCAQRSVHASVAECVSVQYGMRARRHCSRVQRARRSKASNWGKLGCKCNGQRHAGPHLTEAPTTVHRPRDTSFFYFQRRPSTPIHDHVAQVRVVRGTGSYSCMSMSTVPGEKVSLSPLLRAYCNWHRGTLSLLQ